MTVTQRLQYLMSQCYSVSVEPFVYSKGASGRGRSKLLSLTNEQMCWCEASSVASHGLTNRPRLDMAKQGGVQTCKATKRILFNKLHFKKCNTFISNQLVTHFSSVTVTVDYG